MSEQAKALEAMELVIRFLDGSGELRGATFGEKPAGIREQVGTYWWRRDLARAWDSLCAALSAPAQGEAVAWGAIEEGELVALEFKRNESGGCTVPLGVITTPPAPSAADDKLAKIAAFADTLATDRSYRGDVVDDLRALLDGREPDKIVSVAQMLGGPNCRRIGDYIVTIDGTDIVVSKGNRLVVCHSDTPTEDKGGAWPDDAAIERALQSPVGLDFKLRDLIRGDTGPVGYSKVDVVRHLLDALAAAAPPALTQPVVDDAMIDRAMDADAEEYGASIPHSRVRRLLVAALTQPAPSSGGES